MTTQPESDQPVIRMLPPWQLAPGSMYGIAQQTLTGQFLIRIEPDYAFDILDSVLTGLLEDTRYEPPAAPSAASGLAGRALVLMAALQVRYSIPVSSIYGVGTPGPGEDGWLTVPVAAPWYAQGSTHACLQWAMRAINAIVSGPADSAMVRDALDLTALEAALKPYSVSGTNMFHFLQAAFHLDIPFRRIAARIFSFGMGCHTRWLDSTFTDRTPHLGVRIAHDKVVTAEVLRSAGLPAPTHVVVADETAAIEAAGKLGYPVVVKPLDQEQGRGVAANLRDADSVRAAFAEAAKVSRKLLVEKHFHGKDYRLTVMGGEVVKIENRIAGGVTGDGVSTIDALLRQVQDTPRFRKIFRDSGKVPLSLDDEAHGLLREGGLTPDSVPADGEYIVLRRKNNVSTGGLQIKVHIDAAHPDNLSLAVRAATLLKLDFAGVDLLIADITASWLETGALICEVNAQPQIGVRTTPAIYREALSALMAGNSRIPAHLIVTTSGTGIAHHEAVQAAAELNCNGISTSVGVWVDGNRVAARPDSAYHAASILLGEPTVRSALCIVAAKDVFTMGLPASRFQSIRVVSHDKAAPAHQRELEALIPRVKQHAAQVLT